MKKLLFHFIIFLLFILGCRNATKSDIPNNMSKINTPVNDTNSGLYKGIYFFDDVGGANEKMDIDLIILINDTCSYLYFGGVLERDFSIKEDMISISRDNYYGIIYDIIYIGEGRIEDDGVYGSVIIKTGQSVSGMVKKVSGITDAEMNILIEAIEQKQEFLSFWNKFIETLANDNAEQLTKYVNFPFADDFGRCFQKINGSRNYDAKDKNEFTKNYSYMFRNDVKNFVIKNLPHKMYNFELYYMQVPDFRNLNFEKVKGKWKLIRFQYEE